MNSLFTIRKLLLGKTVPVHFKSKPLRQNLVRSLHFAVAWPDADKAH